MSASPRPAPVADEDDDKYYLAFEHRVPPKPFTPPAWLEFAWQVAMMFAVGLGAWYLWWRWTASLNWDAAWFALPLVVAETLAYVGMLLGYFGYWAMGDTPRQPPPATFRDIGDDPEAPDSPLTVDVFFPTYSEDPELVRLSILDAKKITYPHAITMKIWVLDDGKREAMKAVAEQEGVGYLTRATNEGFKAGNMHNGLMNTSGDIVVICDADTRPLPNMLADTLGYFRDPKVAWVQAPQWFYDLPEGVPLPRWLGERLGAPGRLLGRAIEAVVGPIPVGKDIFGNDPEMFFDVILRRRNRHNASFCCGASSFHRREAVMAAALREYAEAVTLFVEEQTKTVTAEDLRDPLANVIREEAALALPVMPYRYHVSEDIFTSLVLHADKEAGWKSVFHADPVSRMLSPQDLLSWTVQRFKYAGGTLDIARTHNPLTLPGLSLAQRLHYFTTVYSYFAWTWILVFLAAPIIYGFTGLAPVASYGLDFYAHALPFLMANRIAFMLATWGIDTARGEQYYVASFHLQVRAFWSILRGRRISFPVTPKVRQSGNFLGLVRWHLLFIGLTVAALAFHGLGLAQGWFADPGAYLVNLFWGGYNVLTLGTIVAAAVWKPPAPEAPVHQGAPMPARAGG